MTPKKTNYLSALSELYKLWNQLPNKFKVDIWLGIFLAVIGSFLEIISIGAVGPFLMVLAYPEKLDTTFPLYKSILSSSVLHDFSQEAFAVSVFVISILLAMSFRISVMYFNTCVAFKLGINMSNAVFESILHKQYPYHLTHNSAGAVSLISQKVNTVIGAVLYPSLVFFSSLIMFIIVAISLGVMYPLVTLSLGVTLICIYALIALLARKAIIDNSYVIADNSVVVLKIINEALGGIRDVIIDNSQDFFSKIFVEKNSKLKLAESKNILFSQSPRFLIEALGMISIAMVAYFFSRSSGDLVLILPVLGAFALGAQRILPLAQQIYSSWVSINGSVFILSDVLNHYNRYEISGIREENKIKERDEIVFQKNIVIKNICFSYNENVNVLNEVNIEIKKGERIGFFGPTGSGKSTLIDILLGLIPPTKGGLLVDGVVINIDTRRMWQSKISHVPQSIFISDGTILENVTFGADPSSVDRDRAFDALYKANLADFVSSLPEGINSRVGERGVLLSGGQRQRIGIARALYKKSEVIILDEATSALDIESEGKIMETVYGLDKNLTVIMIAHRLTTMKECDRVIRLDGGVVVCDGKYDEVISPLLTKAHGY